MVVVGYKGGYNLKGDSENGGVLIGSQAGYNLTDEYSYMGASNMFIGYQAGYNFTTAIQVWVSDIKLYGENM